MGTRGRVGSRWLRTGAGLGVFLAVAAGELTAQHRHGRQAPYAEEARPAFHVGALVADARGDMGRHVEGGIGLQAGAALPLDRTGHLRLRADVGFLVYGHERQRVCFGGRVGCRIDLDLTTTNSILFAGVGPEVLFATGRVSPYVNASGGFSYFATTSSLSGSGSSDDFAGTTHFSDVVFAWRAGGGLRLRLNEGRRPVSLDLGLEHHRNGVVEYLTEGDIEDNPDGSITLYPTRGDADLMALRLGVSIGLGGDRDRDRDRRRRDRRR